MQTTIVVTGSLRVKILALTFEQIHFTTVYLSKNCQIVANSVDPDLIWVSIACKAYISKCSGYHINPKY